MRGMLCGIIFRTMLCGIFVLGIMAETFAQTDQETEFVIPRMKKAPVIDGKIGLAKPDYEWNSAIRLGGFSSSLMRSDAKRPQASPANEIVWVGWDDQALYLALGAYKMDVRTLQAEVRDRDGLVWTDECFEVHLTIDGVRYQFVVNAVNSIYDAVRKPGDSRHNKKINPKWTHAVSKMGDGWTAEVAIPWSELGVAKPQPGQTFTLNVGHLIVTNRRSKPTISCLVSMKEANDNRNRPFSECGAVVRLGDEGLAAGAFVSLPKKSPSSIVVKLINSSNQPIPCEISSDGKTWQKETVKANSQKGMDFPMNMEDDGQGQLPLYVRTADDPTILQYTVYFRSQLGSQVALRKYFPNNYVELVSEVNIPENMTIEGEVRDRDGKRVFLEQRDIDPSNKSLLRIAIDQWNYDEPYTILVNIKDKDGQESDTRRYELSRPRPPEWLGTKAGLSDQPLPPYTPIIVKDGQFEYLQTVYRFDERALPVSVLADGKEILADPMSVTLQMDGKIIDLADIPIRIGQKKSNRVEWSAEKQVNNLLVRFDGWTEEEGFVWCKMAISSSEPVDIQKLKCSIPFRKDVVKYISCLGGGNANPREGLIWNGTWKPLEFYCYLTVINNERGMTVVSADPMDWVGKDRLSLQTLRNEGDATIASLNFIDSPIRLDRPRTYEFGFVAMPPKKLTQERKLERRLHNIHYGDEIKSAGEGCPSTLTYPLKGNIDLAKGTLDVLFYADFDATVKYEGDPKLESLLNRKLLQITNGNDSLLVTWNNANKKWVLTRQIGGKSKSIQGKHSAKWLKPGWHHLTISWGDALQLFADGKNQVKLSVQGLLPGSLTDQSSITFGKTEPVVRSEFRLAALRMLNRNLSPDDLTKQQDIQKIEGTLLFQDFRSSGKSVAECVAAASGSVIGNVRFETVDGIRTLTLGNIPDLTRLEYAASLGVCTMIYHDLWAEYIGVPRPASKSALHSLVKGCKENNIRLLPYFGAGISLFAPESLLYDDYWRKEPVYFWNGGGTRYMHVRSPKPQYVRDYLVDGIDRLMREYKIGGIYTDGVITMVNDYNAHHGAGWIDEKGNLQPTRAVLESRELIKRLYGVVKLNNPDGKLDNHCSSSTHGIAAAWSDSGYNGEQFMPKQRASQMTPAETAVGFTCRPYGIPIDYIWIDGRLDFEQQMAYCLLFDAEPRSQLTNSERIGLITRLWKIKDDFNMQQAQWVNWTDASSFVQTGDDNVYSALHLVPGKRALVVVSNLQDKTVELNIKLDVTKLGIKNISVQDVWSHVKTTLSENKVNVTLKPYQFVILSVE